MALSEFGLIEQYFARRAVERRDVALGIGDDAALLMSVPDHELVSAFVTLTEGTDFMPTLPAASLARRAFAVAFNRLAATGAAPAWTLLSLTLPYANPTWLEDFSDGLYDIAHRFRAQLIGGDTSRGPMSITVCAMGFVPTGRAICHTGARPGDLIYVTGTLGRGAPGTPGKQPKAEERPLHRHAGTRELDSLRELEPPMPRSDAGILLRGMASAAIDISQGLARALDTLVSANRVGATVHVDRLPLATRVRPGSELTGDWPALLSAGGDYELCFTLPPSARDSAEKTFADAGMACTRIGTVSDDTFRLVWLEGTGADETDPV